MHCPLPATAKRVAKSVVDFLIHGATDNATRRSLEKQRLAPQPEPRVLDLIDDAAGQPAIDLQEPRASAVPQGNQPFITSDAPLAQSPIHFPAHNDTYWVGNGIGHDGSSNLIVPGWAIITFLVTVCLLFFSAIGLLVAYETQRAATRREVATLTSKQRRRAGL